MSLFWLCLAVVFAIGGARGVFRALGFLFGSAVLAFCTVAVLLLVAA